MILFGWRTKYVGNFVPMARSMRSPFDSLMSIMRHAEEAPIAKAAHCSNFERPEQLNPLVHAFLYRHVLRVLRA